jgi:NADPH-dependent ferric siderophore reductase
MAVSVDNVREFVLQIEKTLAARRLYKAGSGPYRDANEKLVEKCRLAAAGETLTVRVGATDIFLEKVAVLSHPKREDSFFFPLYRDGLRDLTFTPETTPADLEGLLQVFETKEQQLGSADDMVNYLWRRNLSTIHHSATDGISEGDDDGSGGPSLVALIADLDEKIRSPKPQQSARSRSAEHPRQDAAGVAQLLEQNAGVLALSEAQTAELRAEIAADDDQHLMERFIEILFTIPRYSFKSIDPATIAGILTQLVDGYWTSHDYEKLTALLTHMGALGREAPDPAAQKAMGDGVKQFLTEDRLNAIMANVVSGTLPASIASRLWDLTPEAQVWPLLLDTYSKLLDGEARNTVLAALRKRLAANVDLLGAAFVSPEVGRVRAAMALLDERTEHRFADQIIKLASHPDESVRLKGLGIIAKLGRPESLEILWKAMESDPSKSVRLYAFRAVQQAKLTGLAPRLTTLVTSPQFAERPAWERDKYVRLLGSVAGASAESLFESWIPGKKLLWMPKDLENLEVALRGLASTGPGGHKKVEAIAAGGGKPGDVARKVLETMARAEFGTMERPLPEPPKS